VPIGGCKFKGGGACLKRIALFPSAFHPSLGGVEELSGQLARSLAKIGLEVMIFTNRWPRELPVAEEWKGIGLRRLPFRLPEAGLQSRLSCLLTRRPLLRELIETVKHFNPDIIHVQCVSSNGWYASAVSAALGLPLVITVQGELTMDAGGIYQRSPLYNRMLRHVLESAHRVTGCSAATLGDLEQYWGRSFDPRAAVVHNGIGLEAFESGQGWVHRAPYFLALGRVVPQKGFYELLSAYARSGIKDTDLILAGDGPDMARLCVLREKLGLTGRAHFIGRAGRRAVHSLMRGAVGVVVPSLLEPFGIVSLEAMAAGKRLLASQVGGIPEVVPNGGGVRLVPPGNVDALAEGLSWLVATAHGDCSEALRRHAMRFVWPRIAERYLTVYREAQRAA
jgi:glycogen(starch) synthase